MLRESPDHSVHSNKETKKHMRSITQKDENSPITINKNAARSKFALRMVSAISNRSNSKRRSPSPNTSLNESI